MPKGKINLTCLLFSCALSLFLYILAARAFFIAGWNFDILMKNHWLFAWQKWQAGWVIQTPKEIIYFTSLVLLIPGWLLTWLLMYLLPWKKILGFPILLWQKKKKEKLIQKSIEAAKGPANMQEALAVKKAPKEQIKPIRISPDKAKEIDRLRGKRSTPTPMASPQSAQQQEGTFFQEEAVGGFSESGYSEQGNFIEQGTSTSVQKKEGPTLEEQALQRVQLWNGLAETLEKANVFIFREMKINSYPTNIIAVTQESVFILSEGPAVGEEWTIAEDEQIPVWRVGKDSISSPLRPLVKARDDLKKYIEEELPQQASLAVNACLILDHGNITNPPDLITKLETWDISVLRMGTSSVEALPGTNALIEYIKSQPASTQEVNDAVAVAILDLMEADFG